MDIKQKFEKLKLQINSTNSDHPGDSGPKADVENDITLDRSNKTGPAPQNTGNSTAQASSTETKNEDLPFVMDFSLADSPEDNDIKQILIHVVAEVCNLGKKVIFVPGPEFNIGSEIYLSSSAYCPPESNSEICSDNFLIDSRMHGLTIELNGVISKRNPIVPDPQIDAIIAQFLGNLPVSNITLQPAP